MSINLSLLPAEEKNRIELDKQAAFLVWKLKQAKAGPEELRAEADKLSNPDEKAWFTDAIDKYKRLMGLS